MLKKITALTLALALLLCGCSGGESAGGGEYSFTDDSGASVSLDKSPERVAVLFSSFAEIWQNAGGEISITIGESVERGFAAEGTPLVDDGAGKTIDVELLISYKPDFVLASADIEGQADAAALLRAQGIPTALMRVESFDDYLRVLKICTDLTEKPENYETYGTAIAARIDAVRAAAESREGERPDILFIRAGSSESSVKAKTASDQFAAAMLDELGAHNIADDAPVLLDGLSLEEIIVRDPDCIFVVAMGDEAASRAYMDELLASDGWRDLGAVKSGNCFFLPKELFHFKPNARWADAYEYLFDLLYPDALDG